MTIEYSDVSLPTVKIEIKMQQHRLQTMSNFTLSEIRSYFCCVHSRNIISEKNIFLSIQFTLFTKLILQYYTGCSVKLSELNKMQSSILNNFGVVAVPTLTFIISAITRYPQLLHFGWDEFWPTKYKIVKLRHQKTFFLHKEIIDKGVPL